VKKGFPVRQTSGDRVTVQEKLRSLGFQATNFVLTNDEVGDARLVAELKRAEYDGVAIGGYINGQDAVNSPICLRG
jgi:soluble P-type ATPase